MMTDHDRHPRPDISDSPAWLTEKVNVTLPRWSLIVGAAAVLALIIIALD
jgi:hypothetical protein